MQNSKERWVCQVYKVGTLLGSCKQCGWAAGPLPPRQREKPPLCPSPPSAPPSADLLEDEQSRWGRKGGWKGTHLLIKEAFKGDISLSTRWPQPPVPLEDLVSPTSGSIQESPHPCRWPRLRRSDPRGAAEPAPARAVRALRGEAPGLQGLRPGKVQLWRCFCPPRCNQCAMEGSAGGERVWG